ncbi:E3 ubiquitin-protein ligase [Tetrabaena socialis]|uniref:HECT-type E3 ubiquitin transferase n=1 Tax=Tetrabaena socialis TaxID=47790 RepID=A0A2J8ACM1_9CHLO|nr:E3 ubiquitin-protein ligase [Tetrabaena socialis]|eukprot:PNH10256.1 E3 ubiquitin-protein ligase [Tetrabaena socialis]
MFFPSRRNDKSIGGRGGKSRQEPTAEEEIARARQERDKRKRVKAENKASICIQAAWRGWSSQRRTRERARAAWDQRFGSGGQLLHARECLSLSSGSALGALLVFYNPAADFERLASVARGFAAASKTDDFSELASAYNTAGARAVLLYRLKALALQCLRTLSWHRRAFAPVLMAPRPAAPLDPASGGAAGALQECLLLVVNADTYTHGSLGKAQATTLSAAVLGHLADHGMCRHLFILASSSASPAPSAAMQQQPQSLPAAAAGGPAAGLPAPAHGAAAAKPYMEALVTQLTVRLLALKSWTPGAPEDSLHSLLFVPDLWQRFGSLNPVAPRVARLALGWLAAAGPHRLAALLPPDDALPGGGGAAVAVLVANVLAVGPRLLQADKAAAAAPPLRGPALSAARVLHAAVSLLPLAPFFPGGAAGAGGVGGLGDDEDDEVDMGACASLGLSRLVLSPAAAALLPAGLVQQVQGLTGSTGRQLVKQLVAVLLPYTGAAPDATAGSQVVLGSSPPAHQPSLLQHQSSSQLQHQPSSGLGAAAAAGALPSTAALLEAAEGAHALSELVWQLAQLPGQQQRVMLGLAVSCNFVERMWWSFLRPARLADLAGITWLPPDDPRGATACGSSLGARGAGCSGSASFSCTGSGPMDVELPSMFTTATGVGAAGGGGWGGGALGRPGSRSASGSMQVDGGAGAMTFGAGGSGGDGGSGAGAMGGGGGGGCAWRPRVEEELGWLLPLTVTCSAFSAHVTTSNLDEFYGGAQRPLPLQQLHDPAAPEAGFVSMLRDGLWHVLWSDWETEHTAAGEALYAVLARTGGQLYGILYERNCRRSFCPTEAFHATALAPDRFLTEASTVRSNAGREDGSSRVWQVLEHAPYLVPFADRARLFQLMVGKEREEYRAQEDNRFMEMGMLEAGLGNRFVPIRRDQLLFDGFDRLNSLGERLRGRVRIMFIDAHGAPEAGVDGGGLFKDFMEELMRAGLSAEYGLFASNASHQLYPNPAAMRVVEDAPRLLGFLGRMLGKAMYENVLLELPLAGFFLKKFRGAHCDLNDLPTLDPELYRSMLRLREHFATASAASATGDGAGGGADDAMDLCLTFTVADDVAAALGDSGAEVELKPGGAHIAVTADNVREYIHRVAHYKLNISPRPAVSAFLSGFYELIPRSLVSMFIGEELQTLISGSDQRLDLGDLRANVEYAGGYHEDHPVVHCLWEALESFEPEDQGKFLKFVTSCSRAPLLGFKYLEPRLCIQMSGGMLDPAATQRLPTSSTCMNLLKLPPYRTTQLMREKLLYAVKSGAGFDLS